MAGLFICQQEIAYISPGLELRHRRSGIWPQDLAEFAKRLSSHPLPDKKIHLVLDQSLLHFQSLVLPWVPTRKLKPLLRFELENHFLGDLNQFTLVHQARPNKVRGQVRLQVFGIETNLLSQIKEALTELGFEVGQVLALENLLSLVAQSPTSPDFRTHLVFEPGLARIFCFEEGFLSSVTTLPQSQKYPESWLPKINGVLRALALNQKEKSTLTLERSAKLAYVALADFQIEARPDPPTQPLPFTAQNFLLEPTWLRSKGLLPIEERRAALLSEWNKHKGALKKTGTLAACLALVWALGLGLSLFDGSKRVTRLEAQLAQTASLYLPQVPPAQALKILKQRVSAESGAPVLAYPYATGLAGLSKIKEQAPSLQLSRLSAKGRDWTFIGKTGQAQDFETTKTELSKLFPAPDYVMILSQKAQGEGEVSFSVTIKGGR